MSSFCFVFWDSKSNLEAFSCFNYNIVNTTGNSQENHFAFLLLIPSVCHFLMEATASGTK